MIRCIPITGLSQQRCSHPTLLVSSRSVVFLLSGSIAQPGLLCFHNALAPRVLRAGTPKRGSAVGTKAAAGYSDAVVS